MKLLKKDTDDLNLFYEGKIIHKTKDDVGTILVLDYPKYRVMTFDSVCEQSCMNRARPEELTHKYTQAMMLALAFINPKHVTLLGLGGGCLLRAIHCVLPNVTLEAIEQRAAVIDVCDSFFGLPKVSHVNTHVYEGGQFLKQMQPGTTDIIFADMYDEYAMDPTQEQETFLISAYHALTSTGCLVLNFHSLPDKESEFFICLHQFFSDILICTPSSGNYVLYASKARFKETISEYSNAYKSIDRKINGQASHLFRNIMRKSR